MKAVALMILVAYSACSMADGYVRIGVGNNSNLTGASVPWDNGGGRLGALLEVAYDWELEKDVYLRAAFLHLSQYDAGEGYNNKDESSVDHIGLSIVWVY